jgi:hypothetical protein
MLKLDTGRDSDISDVDLHPKTMLILHASSMSSDTLLFMAI